MDEGRKVDDGTKVMLHEWKDEIIKDVTSEIGKQISSLENHISKVFDIRIESIEKDIDSLKSQSNQHYDEQKEETRENLKEHANILEKVDEKLAALRSEITGLDRRQSFDEGSADGTKSTINLQLNKKTVFWTALSVIAGIVLFLVGLAIPDSKVEDMVIPKKSLTEDSRQVDR